jgi:putative transport protein
VRRGDTPLLANPALALELGDRVTVLAPRAEFPALRKYFGDSIKSTTEFSYVSVGLGMTLGVLVGLVPIPLPGMGSFTLGLAGGSFVTALVLGRLGRTGPWSWHMPLPANLTLRNFGLTLFLAAVGLGAGAPFVDVVARTGVVFLAVGAATVLVALLVVMLCGYFLLKMSTDELFGAVSGATGNPAILAFANQTVVSEGIDVAYATIFPSATILKIVCAQVFMTLLR